MQECVNLARQAGIKDEKIMLDPGSPIIFNQDFFGNHGDVKTVAGPFTDKKASEQKLF